MCAYLFRTISYSLQGPRMFEKALDGFSDKSVIYLPYINREVSELSPSHIDIFLFSGTVPDAHLATL